jgi:O-antigen/teichoic acid export membrane protein
MLFFWPAGFVVLPVFSDLETAKNQAEIKHLYTQITKWMTALTLPFVLFLVTFPNLILRTVFTPSFGRAGFALAIITVTFFTHVVAGANRQTLTALGDSTAVFKGMVGALFLNILLNILLIPQLGIEGAALATAISYGLLNVFYNSLLYRMVEIQPFTWRLATTLGVGLFLFVGVYALFRCLIEPTFWRVFGVAIGYTLVYATAFVFTGGLEPKDAELLIRLNENSPLNLRPIVRLAKE